MSIDGKVTVTGVKESSQPEQEVVISVEVLIENQKNLWKKMIKEQIEGAIKRPPSGRELIIYNVQSQLLPYDYIEELKAKGFRFKLYHEGGEDQLSLKITWGEEGNKVIQL